MIIEMFLHFLATCCRRVHNPLPGDADLRGDAAAAARARARSEAQAGGRRRLETGAEIKTRSGIRLTRPLLPWAGAPRPGGGGVRVQCGRMHRRLLLQRHHRMVPFLPLLIIPGLYFLDQGAIKYNSGKVLTAE